MGEHVHPWRRYSIKDEAQDYAYWERRGKFLHTCVCGLHFQYLSQWRPHYRAIHAKKKHSPEEARQWLAEQDASYHEWSARVFKEHAARESEWQAKEGGGQPLCHS